MKLSSLKVDSARSEAGEWVDAIPDCGDLALKVRGSQCAAARALRMKLTRALPLSVRQDPAGIPLEALDEIETRVLLDVILIDWRNVEEGAYTRETAERYLTDPDYALFREAVAWASARVGRDAAAAREADLGN